MPIYEYLCSECSHTLDALQKLSEDPLVYCPQCGAAALKRQVSAPSFRLKGGGWYETDFKNDRRRNILEPDSKAEEKTSAKKDDKPADGKAAKTETAAKSDKSAPAETKKSGGESAAAKQPSGGKAGDAA